MRTIALYEVVTPVDKELEDVANSIGKEPEQKDQEDQEGMDSSEFSFDDDDMSDMDSDFDGEGDMDNAGGGDEFSDGQGQDQDDENYKELLKTGNIDDSVLTAVKGMDYIRDYDHDVKSPTHPYAIMAMDVPDLDELKTTVTNALNMAVIQSPGGAYDKKNIAYYDDMIQFVNGILKVKKQQATSDVQG